MLPSSLPRRVQLGEGDEVVLFDDAHLRRARMPVYGGPTRYTP